MRKNKPVHGKEEELNSVQDSTVRDSSRGIAQKQYRIANSASSMSIMNDAKLFLF